MIQRLKVAALFLLMSGLLKTANAQERCDSKAGEHPLKCSTAAPGSIYVCLGKKAWADLSTRKDFLNFCTVDTADGDLSHLKARDPSCYGYVDHGGDNWRCGFASGYDGFFVSIQDQADSPPVLDLLQWRHDNVAIDKGDATFVSEKALSFGAEIEAAEETIHAKSALVSEPVAQSVSKPAQAQAPSLSADDTVAYINKTLHKYPSTSFIESGCSGYQQVITISADRRSLVIRQNFPSYKSGDKCDNLQTITVPVFSLKRDKVGKWYKEGQGSSFYLLCTDGAYCFSRRPDLDRSVYLEDNLALEATAPDEISDRLTRAIEHLVDALLDEAKGRSDDNDPFAKHQ